MKVICVVCKKNLKQSNYVCNIHPQEGVQIADFTQDCQKGLLIELGGGVCRGFVLLWIRHMKTLKDQAKMGCIKALETSNFSDIRNDEKVLSQDEGDIRAIMVTQKDLLAEIKYRWSDEETGKPFSDVHGPYASFAMDNQGQAIQARHQLAVRWAFDNDMTCWKTVHTFSSTQELVQTTLEIGKTYRGVLGYIGIQGAGGHALGFGYQESDDNDFSVMFFDPNSGEFLFRSPQSFATASASTAWLNKYLNNVYPDLLKVMYVHFFL